MILNTNKHFSSEQKFDDETRDIRNASNALIRKVHERVNRSNSVLPASFYSSKYERRYSGDSFVSSLSGPLKSTTYNGVHSYDPNKYIGEYQGIDRWVMIELLANTRTNYSRTTQDKFSLISRDDNFIQLVRIMDKAKWF